MTKPFNSGYFNQFKSVSMTLLSNPIHVALYERKTSKKELIKMLAEKGSIYDYFLLVVMLDGKATNYFNLHYFTHIYHVLGLPMPTPDYLYKSYLRWEEIKQIKLDRRNANRIKKGLQPVNSLSTRIK